MAKKGSNGGGASKTYDPAKEAAARKAAQERKKRAAGGREVHNLPGLNQGLGGIARREHERKLELADKRQEQHDAALAMLPGLVASDLARMVAEAVLAEFLTARPYNAASGKRVGATEVAVRQARAKHTALFRTDPAAAEAGVKAIKKALWRAANPDWEKVEARERQQRESARRSQSRRKPAATPKKAAAPTSPEQIKKLRDTAAAARLDANLARAGVSVTVNGRRISRQTAEDRLAAAEKALKSVTAA